jgi:hypothetical protein
MSDHADMHDHDHAERPRRSIDAEIDYFMTRFRTRGHTMRNRWDTDFPQGGRRMTAPSGSLRVSDAERNEVADTLSTHFADGRLDEAEFKERLDAAMAAKTQADLSGLFDDLPPLPKGGGTVTPDDRQRRRRRSFPVLATILIVALIGVASVPPVPWFHVPWFLIGIVALFLWARVVRHRHGWHRS